MSRLFIELCLDEDVDVLIAQLIVMNRRTSMYAVSGWYLSFG